MILLFAVLLSSLVFGDVSNVIETCDPNTAARECYAELCVAPSENFLLQNPEDVLSALKKSNRKISPDLSRMVKLQLEGVKRIKFNAAKAIEKGEVSTLVDHLIENPLERTGLMNDFFAGRVRCVPGSFPCEIIKSDLKNVSEGVAEAYRKTSDLKTVSEKLNQGTLESKTKAIIIALRMIGPHKKNFSVEQEIRKVQKINNEKTLEAFLEKEFPPDFQKLMALSLAEHRADLIISITERSKEILAQEHRESQLVDSCLLTSEFEKEIRGRATKAHFKKSVDSLLTDIHANFSSKLSPSSAKGLNESLKSEVFQLIELKEEWLWPELIGQDYQLTDLSGEIITLASLKALPKTDASRTLGCRLSGIYPMDHFSDNGINISAYSLATANNTVLAHEAGHWISHRLIQGKFSKHSAQKLLRVRSCVQSFNPHNKMTLLTPLNSKGDTQTTEEDFSDWFAGQFKMPNGYFCNIEKLIKPNVNDLYLPGYDTAHSNTLFRELNLRVQRNEKIPKSCQDLMSSYPEIQIKKCEL